MQVENFLSFREAAFDFRDQGLVLVEGDNEDDDTASSNGSGKSAMIDALVWCLFGETLRGYKHDEVVHRKVGAGCLVKVCLVDGDELYTVSRARKHPKLRNALTLTHDNLGDDVSGASDKDTQLAVEKLLGCTLKTFLSSVVFGQDRTYRFSSLTDAEQKKILDEVIGVERFARAGVAARARVSSLQADRERVERDLEKATKARAEAELEVIDANVKHADFEEIQQKRVEVEREKLSVVNAQLAKTKTANVPHLKSVVDKVLKELGEAERAADKAVEVDATARALVASCADKYDEVDAELRKQKKLTACPTCGQKISPKKREEVLGELATQHGKLAAVYHGAQVAAKKAAAELAASKSEIKTVREMMTSAQKLLNDAISSEANAATLRRRAADHEEWIAELEGEASPYLEIAEKALARHERHDAEAAMLEARAAEHADQLRCAEFWVKAYGNAGLRSLLIDTSLPLLNKEAARVSRVVTGGAISVSFSATSEQKSGKTVDRFEVRVDNVHGAATYAGNSAGERAKIDLCVGLALQRLVASRSSSSFNVAFYDEVFDHLDSAAHERVIEVLAGLDKASVFVVSHDDDLKAWFPATLRIVKRGGFSSVEA
jgi:DNA repair exonuclease SbcCD ATPase subunit